MAKHYDATKQDDEVTIPRAELEALEDSLTVATAANESLYQVIRDLTDPDDCWFDHHGYCQAHSWLEDGECPHARAKRLVGES